MPAAHEREIVADLVGIGIGEAVAGARVARDEPARHIDVHAMRLVAERLDAEIGRLDGGRVVAVDFRAIEADAERVDRVRAEHARIAEHRRRGPVVQPDAQLVHGRQQVVDDRHALLVEGHHVAAEERVVGSPLVVDLGDDLALVALGPWPASREPMVAARIGRGGEPSGKVDRRRTEERGIDPVVHKRRPQHDLPAVVAGRRGERREVAGEHRRRRHVSHVVVRRLIQVRALIAAEEEQPVAHDRPAERPAELVPRQPVVLSLAVRPYRRKPARRIEALVAKELEQVAVEVVGARLRDRVDRRPGSHAVVGRQAARRDAEFLQRVRERQRHAAAALQVVVHGAIEKVRHAEGLTAGHRHTHAAGEVVGRRRSCLHRGAREHDQVGNLASLERQLENPLLLDHLADAGAAHVDERRSRFDGDGLFKAADREHGIDRGRGRHLQHDAASARRCGTPAASLPADTARAAGSVSRTCRRRR